MAMMRTLLVSLIESRVEELGIVSGAERSWRELSGTAPDVWV